MASYYLPMLCPGYPDQRESIYQINNLIPNQMSFTRAGFLCLLLLAVAGISNGQQNRKGIEWMMKEKFKINPEVAIKAALQGGEEAWELSGRSTLQYTDVPIVSSSNIDAEVHAAVNPLDSQNILASPIRQSSGSISTPIYYTKNFGGTWSKSPFNPMPAATGAIAIGGGDPVLAFDANGRAYFSWLELHIKNMSTDTIYWGLYWAYSDDGGTSWIRPTSSALAYSKVLYATGTADGPVTDKQWLAVDRTNSIYRNSLYMSYVTIDLSTGTYQIVVHTKPADSMSFNPSPVLVSDPSFTLCQFASLDVDVNGAVHVSFFGTKDNVNYGVYHSSSTDGGLTFSTPSLISQIQIPRFSAGQLSGTVPGISDDRLYPSIYLAANKVTQDIYVTWTANGITSMLNNGLDIYFSTSSDGGASWSPAKVINDDQSTFEAHQYYSSISCGPEGNVIMGWYDRRDDTANIKAHYYFTESFDHGNILSPAYQVSTNYTDFSKVGISNNNFGIGEYTQILGLKDYIIPVWTDGRTNNGNLNIYVAFVNRKTMSIDQLTGVNRILGVQAIFPNPLKDLLNIELALSEASMVEVLLIDQQGKFVATLFNAALRGGDHMLSLNLASYSAGVYHVLIRSGSESFSRKVLINR
jgi:hypothetical protein